MFYLKQKNRILLFCVCVDDKLKLDSNTSLQSYLFYKNRRNITFRILSWTFKQLFQAWIC